MVLYQTTCRRRALRIKPVGRSRFSEGGGLISYTEYGDSMMATSWPAKTSNSGDGYPGGTIPKRPIALWPASNSTMGELANDSFGSQSEDVNEPRSRACNAERSRRQYCAKGILQAFAGRVIAAGQRLRDCPQDSSSPQDFVEDGELPRDAGGSPTQDSRTFGGNPSSLVDQLPMDCREAASCVPSMEVMSR